ncbi:type III PLP-dependent enzyme [Paenibacillus elgii]|uniref:Type III PLP-dependent enzyme n=1 Tax=Paenibacillus elgii TaxID=189691 RepID=A0A2T6FRW6_9BACL|nr:type III PLP-dependent enzyme [Paenibacillus elgii]PUA34645.1 type III PLP-dependent enzyme [Paenibacillus elgii]
MVKINNRLIEICSKYPTPFYLYDGRSLYDNYHEIRKSLDESVEIFLSLKANNNVSLAKLFAKWGTGVEVASKGELLLALKAGFSPENIIFSGPGKLEEELELAIREEIYCIIIESLEEAKKVELISSKLGINSNIGIRVNPDCDITNARIKMAGVPRQFGIDEDDIGEVCSYIKDSSHLVFKGIHVYVGTQILNPDEIVKSMKYTIELAKHIQETTGFEITMLNLGGGFGVPYFSHEKPLDIGILMSQVNGLIYQAKQLFPNARFIVESGRYLLATSGRYIAKAIYKKKSKGEEFIVVDGGMNHHAASTFRGRTMRNNYPIKVIKKNNNTGDYKTTNIVGPLCTPEDCIARSITLPEINVGDYICVENSGAYGLSYSPILFLGHLPPMEILVWEGREYVVRSRGNSDFLLLNQVEVSL